MVNFIIKFIFNEYFFERNDWYVIILVSFVNVLFSIMLYVVSYI